MSFFAFPRTRNTQCQALLSLCISDANKPLLLTNRNFLPHLVHGLLLEPKHHRSKAVHPGDPTDFESVKAAIQRDYSECLQQLALYPAGRDAMLEDESVVPALRQLSSADASVCWSSGAKQCASGALMALEQQQARQPESASPATGGAKVGAVGGGRHVMLSYPWVFQPTMIRLNESLKARGFICWFDLEDMTGSTMDAMANAVDSAAVMVYGVSLAYKESAVSLITTILSGLCAVFRSCLVF